MYMVKCPTTGYDWKEELEFAQYEHQWYERLHQLYIERYRAMPYWMYLCTGHWEQLRKKALAAASYACQECGVKDVLLEVHHLTYDTLGEEKLKDVRALCELCHKRQHGN